MPLYRVPDKRRGFSFSSDVPQGLRILNSLGIAASSQAVNDLAVASRKPRERGCTAARWAEKASCTDYGSASPVHRAWSRGRPLIHGRA